MSGCKRILLLSVSAGAGHGRAAEALRAAAQGHFPEIVAKHIDVMTLVPRSFRALYADYYIKLVDHHPSVWAYLYHATDKMPRDALFAKFQRAIERLNTRKLRDGSSSHGEKLSRMRENMRGLGRPDAARAVLEHVLSDG